MENNDPKKRILVVDDEGDIRDILEFVLQGEGYETECAGNGNEAYAKITSGSVFHLVITDLRMPKASGVDLIRKINTLPNPLPVIAMTGFADLSPEGLSQLGTKAIIPKPFNEPQLIELVTRHIK